MHRSLLLAALLTARVAEAAVVHRSVAGPGLAAPAEEEQKQPVVAAVAASRAGQHKQPFIAAAAASYAEQVLAYALSWRAVLPSPVRRLVSAVPVSLLTKEEEGPHIVVDGGVEDQRVPQWVNFATSVGYLSVFLIWSGVVYLIAHYYLGNVKVKASPLRADMNSAAGTAYYQAAEEALTDYKYGVCECFSDPTTCIWGCCCPCIRWGDNVSSVGILRSFWLAVLIWYGIMMLNSGAQTKAGSGNSTQSSFQDPTAWVIFALIGAGFRHELRLKFKMATDATTFAKDFLLYGFCTCCAIIQDARQVDEAARTGHTAVVKQDDEPAV